MLALCISWSRGDREGVVIEESDARDSDEDVLAGSPAEGSRNGDFDAIVAQAGEVGPLSGDGTDEIGLEKEAIHETADPDGKGCEEVVPAGEHVVAVPEHQTNEAHAGKDVDVDEELVT